MEDCLLYSLQTSRIILGPCSSTSYTSVVVIHFSNSHLAFFNLSFVDHNEHQEADYPSSYYEWRTLYKIFVKKHGGIISMQNYVLKRCLRNRQALEEHYQLSLHSSRQQKWYQYLEDREMGNHKALKALTEHMRPTTHNYMLHQVCRHC